MIHKLTYDRSVVKTQLKYFIKNPGFFSILVLGDAGTGKSYIIKEVLNEDVANVKIGFYYPFEIGALGISIILIFFLGASYQKMNLTSSTSTIAVVLCVLLSAVAAVHSSHGRLGSSVISNGSGRHLKKEKCTDECQFEGETNAGGKNRIPICFIFPEQGESSAPQKDFCQTRCVSATEAEAAIADGEGTCGVCPEFDTTRNTNLPLGTLTKTTFC